MFDCNKWRNAKRHARKAQGLCIYCYSKAEPGYTRCARHMEDNKRYHEKNRNKMKEQGKCPRCGRELHPEMDENHITCMFCREGTMTYRGSNATLHTTIAKEMRSLLSE